MSRGWACCATAWASASRARGGPPRASRSCKRTAMNFSLGTFSQDAGRRFAGLCFGEQVIPLALTHGQALRCGARWPEAASVLELLQDWERNLPVLQALANELAGEHEAAMPMSALHVHP